MALKVLGNSWPGRGEGGGGGGSQASEMSFSEPILRTNERERKVVFTNLGRKDLFIIKEALYPCHEILHIFCEAVGTKMKLRQVQT